MKILAAIVQFIIRPLCRMSAVFFAAIPVMRARRPNFHGKDGRVRESIGVAILALVLAAGVILPLSESFAQESADQEEPAFLSWRCNLGFQQEWRCRPQCILPDGEFYSPRGPDGELVGVWVCPNSRYIHNCDVLRDCLDGEFYQIIETEEYCVNELGTATAETCHENGYNDCLVQAREATQARCDPPPSANLRCV